MDWNVMVQCLPQYEKAAWLTLRLGVAGIFWAILVGLVCAVLQYEKVPVLRRIVGAYIQLSRNTPLLVQLFFLYYGLPKIGIKTNAELCGIAGLAFLGSQDTIAPAVSKGNTTLLDWINDEIKSLGEESFFHKDYEETLVDTYGLDYEDELVVEGGETNA